jgi:protein-tyrosine phosphatase
MEIHEVSLPEHLTGRLFLSPMPGQGESFTVSRDAVVSHEIDKVLCLAPSEEIEERSPEYHRAIRENSLPWTHLSLPITAQSSIPRQSGDLFLVMGNVMQGLERGERILIHCGGLGRSGTIAACLLVSLGIDQLEASIRVADAASGPETDEQERLIEYVAKLHAAQEA